ncbi:mevalonate kinase [Lacticaseibacillus porcinae]|uniref:mevalonate kinase n=1 Tax=Lacticaseibacillus porcinae TaxID=1123687 RepID=UPI000F7ACD7B|nr:mevalonate kinase [Lacticaseibacillus porcinae]
MKNASGESFAKIILIGEHAVVYGQPAIALPVKSIRLTASLTTNTEQIIQSSFYAGSLHAAAGTNFAGIADLISALLKHFNASNQGFTLTIDSALPPERGMGSSAACATAVVRAFYAAFDEPLSRAQLLSWTATSEHAIHGNPSGLDAATTSADRPQWFVKGQPPIPIQFPKNGTLVIADTGIAGQTKVAVGAVAQHLTDDPTATTASIEAIGQATVFAAKALAEDDLQALGTQMDHAQGQLKALGVSNDALNRLIATAKENGALGAKLTGSGQGGCMIALAFDATQATQIRDALTQAGATATWQYDFSDERTN